MENPTGLGKAGVCAACVLAAVISGIYAWRAGVAFFEQSNVPKGITISLMSVAGIVAIVLLAWPRSRAGQAGGAE